jgi:hypothetical protein
LETYRHCSAKIFDCYEIGKLHYSAVHAMLQINFMNEVRKLHYFQCCWEKCINEVGKLHYLLAAGKIFRNEVEKLTLFAVLLGIIKEFGKLQYSVPAKQLGKY